MNIMNLEPDIHAEPDEVQNVEQAKKRLAEEGRHILKAIKPMVKWAKFKMRQKINSET